MFSLSSTEIEAAKNTKKMQHASCGAIVTFEGWVRNHNEGRAVTRLDYEAYPELCAHEADIILEEARTKFGCIDVHCVHRTGTLAIGDVAVWVGAISVHRENAFKACQYVIDNVKVRLPIWKKEFYADHDSGWVNCEACSQHAHLAIP